MKLNMKGATKIRNVLRNLELNFEDIREEFVKIEFDLDDFEYIDVVEKMSIWQRIKRLFGVNK